MKVVMLTAKRLSPERERFEKAITAATLVIKTIYVQYCVWMGDDLTFNGAHEDYQKLYFWICGFGDACAVYDLERLHRLAKVEDQSLTSVGGLTQKLEKLSGPDSD